MRKIISMILAMAMILTTFGMMSAFAAVADVTFGAYDYELLNIYNVEFNDTTVAKPLAMMDTGFKDSEGKDVDGPTEGAYVDSTREGAGKAYHITYDTTKTYATTGTVAARFNGDTDKMASVEGEKAMVSDCWAMFPSVPTESGKTMQFTSKVKFSGTKQCVTYATSKGDGTMGIGASPNSPSVYVRENEWFRYTDIVVFETKMRYVYINGVNIFYQNLSSAGPEITATGYFQLENYKNIPGGIYVDDVHVYLATDVDPNAPVIPEDTSNPYKYSVTGNAPVDFQGWTINSTTFTDASGSTPKVLGANMLKDYAGGPIECVTDPINPSSTNKVAKFNPTGSNGQTSSFIDIRPSMGTERVTDDTPYIYSVDFYIASGDEVANYALCMSQVQYYEKGKTEVTKLAKYVYAQSNSAGTVTVTYDGLSATASAGQWNNIQWVVFPSTMNAKLYVNNKFVGEKNVADGTFANIGYSRVQVPIKGTKPLYIDNMHVCTGTTTSTNNKIVASGYIPGTTEVGTTVTLTLTAPNFVGRKFQSSTDGENWTDYADTTYELTEKSVWFRAKAGNNVTEPIILYGVQAAKEFVKRAQIWDVDFEPVNGIAYAPGAYSGTTTYGSVNVYGPNADGTASVMLQNPFKTTTGNGNFAISPKVPTTNSATTGIYRTMEITSTPNDYENSEGKGTTALKLTGNGEEATLGSEINIRLTAADNQYPGSSNNSVGTLDNDVYITEFDYGFDSLTTGSEMICQFRTRFNSASTSYYGVYLRSDGKLKGFGGTAISEKALKEKTWYTIKVVAYKATATVETYVNDELWLSETSTTGSLGTWDSFRTYGTGKNPKTRMVAYWDNLNFYIAQEVVASENSNIKLGNIVYKDGNQQVFVMADYDDLNAEATVTNENGAAGSAVIIFARYIDGGKKLDSIDVKKFDVGENQTITVKGKLGKSDVGHNVKVFLWDSLKFGVPHDALESL